MTSDSPSRTAGKVLSRYRKRTSTSTLVLNYPTNEAARLRDLIASIRLRGDREASRSLIARRSLAVYLDYVASSPDAMSDEIEALELLATPLSTRKKTQPLRQASSTV